MYSYGKCSLCGEHTWLMNNKCATCNVKEPQDDMPDFLKGLFK